jgi:hypothetical protein
MSTYTHTDSDGDTLEINGSPDVLALLTIYNGPDDAASVLVPNADAPRVALELLKAAGRKLSDRDSTNNVDANVGVAISHLETALNWQDHEAEAEAARKAEAEAADKAKLDQEAETLWLAASPESKWNLVPENTKVRYRRVALAARELHKDGHK